ncbi:baseplate J/gp47 family protein [Streptomyces stramineus]
MPFPPPSLDDRSFAHLRGELLERIAAYTPEWTDRHPGDPGVTLLELVAFLGEKLLYRFNQIPDATRTWLLGLLHVPLLPAQPARGLVAFTPVQRRNDGTPDGVVLPAATVVGAGSVRFETEQDVTALPVRVRAVAKIAAPAPADPDLVSAAEAGLDAHGLAEDEEPVFYRPVALADDPATGVPLDVPKAVDGTLWLAVTAGEAAEALRRKDSPLAGVELSIGVALDPQLPRMSAADPCPGAEHTGGGPPRRCSGRSPPARGTTGPATGRWRFARTPPEACGTTGWCGCACPRTRARPGSPSRPSPTPRASAPSRAALDGDEEVLFWLRAFPVAAPRRSRHCAGWAPTRPRWSRPSPHSPSTSAPVRACRGSATPSPTGPYSPTCRPWSSKSRRTGSGGRGRGPSRSPPPGRTTGTGPWTRRPAHAPSETPSAAGHRRSVNGSGCCAIATAVVNRKPLRPGPRATAGRRAGHRGQSAPHRGRHRGRDPRPGHGPDPRRIPPPRPGGDRLRLRRTRRAHPGRAGGARRVPAPLPPPSKALDAAGVVTVVVWPRQDPAHPDAPTPERGLLRRVCAHLDARRLITTELYVVPPEYRKVAVSVALAVKAGYSVDAVRHWVELVLRQYLSPLPPYGPEGAGWPLGRRVHGPELEAAALQVEGVEYLNGLDVAQQGEGGAWAVGTVELRPWEVVEPTAIAVIAGDTPLPVGEAPAPPAGTPGAPPPVPVPVPVVEEEC